MKTDLNGKRADKVKRNAAISHSSGFFVVIADAVEYF